MTELLPASQFFGLRPDDDVGSWLLPVEASLASGTGALFGGAALGAAIAAAEERTGRPLVWATVQFVRHVRPPAVLHLVVEELVRGRRASQVKGMASLDGAEVFTFVGTTGTRDEAVERTWTTPPAVPPPDQCPPRPMLPRHRGRFMERTEVRLASARGSGRPGATGAVPDDALAGEGRSSLWARLPDLEPGAATLGALGDYVPFGLREALGDGWATHSLDNSIRVLHRPGEGWILADIVIEGVATGFGQGRVHLWDERGHLLATATQSFTCRRRSD
jgi:acyl-CoA thioesterase-2